MAFYGYEYFCGANTVVEVAGFPILECAGISVNITETKTPLYGYSSKFFDVVGRGRVLVQGSLIVNYVHQDYLFRAVELGRQDNAVLNAALSAADAFASPGSDMFPFLALGEGGARVASDLIPRQSSAESLDRAVAAALEDPALVESEQLQSALQVNFWGTDITGQQPSGLVPISSDSFNPHDYSSPVDIKITFGERNEFNNNTGKTGCYLSSVFFTSRGMPIRIDEEVLVEEYMFFARNMYALEPQFTVRSVDPESLSGELELGSVPSESGQVFTPVGSL